MKRSSSFSVSRRGVLAASTVGALGVAIVAVPLLAVSASATNEHEGDSHKVTICHRNNDAKKPYVKESVDIASTGLLKSGHNDHTGDVFAAGMKDDHEKWGDIIPAYSYKISEHKTFTFKGLNWDGAGQAAIDLCRGVRAFAQGDNESAIGLLEPAIAELPRIGGSHAQRAMFQVMRDSAAARARAADAGWG